MRWGWALAAAAALIIAGLVFFRTTPVDLPQPTTVALDDTDVSGILAGMDAEELAILTMDEPTDDWQGHSLDQALLELEIALEFSEYCMAAATAPYDSL
jgi:hypothetical protein